MGFFGGQAPQPPPPVVTPQPEVKPPVVPTPTVVTPPEPSTYKIANVLDYGADRTGVNDSSDAFNSALIAKNNVFIPEGTYRIDKTVYIRHSGTRLYGAGRHNTIIIVTTKEVSNFGNMEFGGVFVATCNAPGPHISDFMIRFDNDLNPESRNTMIKNRPAITFCGKSGEGVPRGMIEKMAIYRATVGIHLPGNCGGVTIEDVECSSLDIGLHISGETVDSIKVTRWHQWNFDYGEGHVRINRDGLGYAIRVFRCDDLHISDSLFFEEGVYLRDGFGSFSNCDFDAISTLTIKGELSSTWNFSACYFSNAGNFGQPQVIIENLDQTKSNASEVNFVGCSFGTTDLRSVNSPLIRIRGNNIFDDQLSVNFSGCNFRWHDNPLNETTNNLINAENALFTISGSRFFPMLRGVKINTPIIYAGSYSRCAITGCVAYDWGANTRTFFLGNSGTISQVTGCVLPGYSIYSS